MLNKMTRRHILIILFGIILFVTMNFFIIYDFKTNDIHEIQSARIVGLVLANGFVLSLVWLLYTKQFNTFDATDSTIDALSLALLEN